MYKLIISLTASCALAAAADTFTYAVVRATRPRGEHGQLEVSKAGVSYRSGNGKTAIHIGAADIYEADLSDPAAIRITTYDILKRRLTGHRTHTFRLLDGKQEDSLIRFLVDTLDRPVVGAYGAAEKGGFEIPAYHRHRLGGCHGKLQIGSNSIRFVTGNKTDSRTWLYRDIETIGGMAPFHFRVSALVETYNFDLKERLPADAYQLAWDRLYGLKTEALTGPSSSRPRDGRQP
jgi:hypothetical protein